MSTIITRNSATSGSVPSSLVQGELAINVTDGKLFYGSGSGNIVREFTGSGGGGTVNTGSFVTTSSFNAYTGSNTSQFAGTASYATTASYYGGSVLSASYAQTASYAPAYLPLTGGTINGNVTVNGTASIAFLNVTYESASVIYSSGSNQFGDASNDVQTLWGTVDIKSGPVLVTGSLNVTGSANITNQLSASSGHFATRAQIGELGTEQSSVKINGLTFNSNLKVSDLSNSNAAQTILHKHSTTAAPIVVGARSNSDTTSHGAVINDMPTLSIYGAGWTSGTYSLNGQINVGTDDTGTISGTSSPGKIEFWTTPNGTIWPEMAMKIDSNKKLTVSGSVQATSFTGSLQGTSSYATQALSSSYATTASYALNALSASYAPSTPAFPYTGSAGITGSLTVVGKTQSTQIGAGTSPSGSVPLDVKAQGALSTDIAFRVRNSADTNTILSLNGLGAIEVRSNAVSIAQSRRLLIGGTNTDNAVDSTAYDEITMVGYNNINANYRATILGSSNTCNIQGSSPTVLVGYGNTSSTGGNIILGKSNTGQATLIIGTSNAANGGGGGSGIICIGNSNTISAPNGFPTLPMVMLGSSVTVPNSSTVNNCVFLSAGADGTDPYVTFKKNNISIGSLTPWTANFDNNSTGTFYTKVGVAPTTMAAGTTAMYAASSSAGNAKPYFRTENGTTVWLGDESRLFNVTASRTIISSSQNTISGSSLIVYGSGSAQPVFTVQGSQGELFSITDSLSGSLFSVNDISGLPIMEVFSDNTTLMGSYLAPSLNTTAKVVQTNSGSFTMYSLPTASYDTAFFEYSVRSGSNARAGTIMAIQSGSAVNFTETTTTDFGSTSAVSFTVIVTGSNIALTGSSTSGAWTIKTIVRSI